MSNPDQVNVVFVYGAGDDDRYGGGLRYLREEMKDYFGDKIYSPEIYDHKDTDELMADLENWGDPTILVGHSCAGETITHAANNLPNETIPYLMVIAPSVFCDPDPVGANVARITQASSAPGDPYNPNNRTLVAVGDGNTTTVLKVIQTALPHIEVPYSPQVRAELIAEIERALGLFEPEEPGEPPVKGKTPVTVTIDYPEAEVELTVVKKPTKG